jgi:hypothetical protein
MLDPDAIQAVRERKDRDDIYRTMLMYLRGCDRAEWDLVRRAYHPEALATGDGARTTITFPS